MKKINLTEKEAQIEEKDRVVKLPVIQKLPPEVLLRLFQTCGCEGY